MRDSRDSKIPMTRPRMYADEEKKIAVPAVPASL